MLATLPPTERHGGGHHLRAPRQGRGRLLAPSVGTASTSRSPTPPRPARSTSGARLSAAGTARPRHVDQRRTTASSASTCRKARGWRSRTDMRDRPFGILAAIASDGTPQIKALMDGDKKPLRGAALLGGGAAWHEEESCQRLVMRGFALAPKKTRFQSRIAFDRRRAGDIEPRLWGACAARAGVVRVEGLEPPRSHART